MRLSFDSIDEVKEFVKSLKGTRGGKADTDGEGTAGQTAPAPLAPPMGGAGGFPGGGAAFAPPVGGAGQPGGAFPAAGALALAPEVQALVARLVTRIDWAINTSGQPAQAVLDWFRGQCGSETANYTLDQIKQVALPKMSVPALENIAKLMNA